MNIELILGIWGAAVSTVVAMQQIVSAVRDSAKIKVEFAIVTHAVAHADDTLGVKFQSARGDWTEANVEVGIANAGRRALQLTDVFVETSTSIQQLRPDGMPVVLDPNTSVDLVLQPEWFAPKAVVRVSGADEARLDDTPVLAIGVLDALGRRHALSRTACEELVRNCRELPLRTALYKSKTTGEYVAAFQTRQLVRLAIKNQRK
jgi:hypothetical protein